MAIILVDMDSTLNLFNTHMVNWIIARGYELTDKVEKVWNLYEWIDAPKKEAEKAVTDIFCTPGFWIQIPVMKNAIKIMDRINNRYYVKIVTIPYASSKTCEQEKIDWMAKYFPFIKRNQIIFKEDKWNEPGEMIIDDKPVVLEKFPNKTIAIDYGYNSHIQTGYRVKGWIEIANILKV